MATVTSGSPGLGRVRRADLPYVNVLDWTSADPTGNNDSYSAIAGAITQAGVGGCVVIPSGNYIVGTGLAPLVGQRILGEGLPSNFIAFPYAPTAGQGTFLRFTAASGWLFNCAAAHYAEIQNIAAVGPSTTDGLLLIDGCEYLTARRLLLRGVPSGTAVKLIDTTQGVYFCRLEDIQLKTSMAIGLHIASGVNGYVNNNTIRNMEISGAGVGKGVKVDCGNMNVLQDTTIEPAATTSHLEITAGQLIGRNLRIEGTKGTDGHVYITGGILQCDRSSLIPNVIRDTKGASRFELPSLQKNILTDSYFAGGGSYPADFTLAYGTCSTAEASTDRPPFAYSGNSFHGVSSAASVVDIRYRVTTAATLAAAVNSGVLHASAWAKSVVGAANGIVLKTFQPSGNASNTTLCDRTGEWQFLKASIPVKADITAFELLIRLGISGDEAYVFTPAFAIGEHAYRV